MPAVTLSGNEITDALRALGVQGDGLAQPDSSFGIWEASTNLVTNGGFETNATGWNAVSSVLTRIVSQFKFGGASGEFVSSNLVANEGGYHNFTATAAVYTVSAWVRGAAGGTVRMAVRDNAGGSAQTGTAVTLTSAWQRITLTTTALTAATWRCYVETNVQQAVTFQIDGVQAELQPLATPYIHTDGATATRTAARVQAPASLIDETQAWVAMRVRMGWGNTTEPLGGTGSPRFFSFADDSNNRLVITYDEANNRFSFLRRNTTAATQTVSSLAVAKDDLVTLIARWTATTIHLSVNGGAFTTSADTNIPTLAATTFDIGTGGTVSAGSECDSDVLWFACGTGTLTDTNAATIHAIGNASRFDPWDIPGDCTGLWHADTADLLTPRMVAA